MTAIDPAIRRRRPVGPVAVVFAALTVAAVAMTAVAAFWHHDGAAVFGYVGGGMFGGALAYFLLEVARLRRDPDERLR